MIMGPIVLVWRWAAKVLKELSYGQLSTFKYGPHHSLTLQMLSIARLDQQRCCVRDVHLDIGGYRRSGLHNQFYQDSCGQLFLV